MDRKLNDILETEESDVDLMSLINVERLIERYSYSSVLYAYAAKFSMILNNQNKDKYLLSAAAYVAERSALKNFIEQPLKVRKTNKEVEKQVEESIKQSGVKQVEESNIIEEINSYREPDLSENPTREEVRKRFLRIEPPETPNSETETESAEIETVIKRSATSDFKIVTETMAQIYLKQGNKDKALQIYRQLLADNPKKSVYFADRIRELEQE
ncbi:MAG: tetratricopeptide repeat protein [Bacteroidales bacterium]|nr:tetratricopeptide repeat protein [Bacteroidales bacterium]